MTTLAPLLQTFFTERLQKQRGASSHTVAAYRDTFKLLLRFAKQHLAKEPTDLLMADLNAPLIATFLDHLEVHRHNTVRTRNARLAAIRSFFRFAAIHLPDHLAQIQRILAIPQKRAMRTVVGFLTRPEIEAVLAAPNRTTWVGRRDAALLVLAIHTGLRVSEIVGLRARDIVLGPGAHVRCQGKGRKERCTPLRGAVPAVRDWLHEQRFGPTDFLFPSRRGGGLSRDAVESLVHKYTQLASASCPSLRGKRVTPHVLRHTTAVELLRGGNDVTVVALYLGHESVETARIYIDADLTLKERALARAAPPSIGRRRFQPGDALLAYLTSL
jgi:integrase/recombinase XerD